MNKISYILLFFVAILFASCDRTTDYDIEYIPFQEEEDGRYGLISPDGKVLFSEEFRYSPTMATCGRFWALNKDGYYELYNTSKNPERRGGEYRYVSLFFRGRAIVAERDKHMSIVDKDGKTLVSLEKIGSYRPDFITSMREGHAVFAVDTLQGLINYDGEMVIKPSYYAIEPMYDSMVVAVDRNYAMSSESDTILPKAPKGYLTVINDHGEKVLKISNKKYQTCAHRVFGQYLPVAAAKNGKLQWGIINLKGEEIVKPSTDNHSITMIQGENFIYMNDEGLFGVKNFKGEKILPAKYDYLEFAGDGIVYTSHLLFNLEDEYADSEGKFISLTDEKISSPSYSYATPFLPTARKYAFASTGEGKWRIVNTKGERLADTPKLYNIDLNAGNELILSDYINIDKFLNNVGFSANGLDSLTFNSSVQTVLDRQARHFSFTTKSKPADLLNTSQVYISRTVDGQNVAETIYFPTSLSHRTYRTETVYDYDYYYNWYGNYWDTYWYTYNRQVPAGFAFSSSTPSKFEMTFDNFGVLRGKLKTLYQKLSKEFKRMGEVVEENNSAVLVKLPGGKEAAVYIDGHNVVAVWGQLSNDDRNIGSHYGAKETIELD
ncbi:MAG: WG repeat-containing protein [Prevotella sp.]|nr:WG repeat-containing protein [Bacteroides sp.]MCM1366705.1 WG repeat-containing protein [Prevotella sp.]MCM1437281.1 WG repeat-containing protein [Prevotella sp.]